MIKNKKQMYTIIGVFTLVMMLGTVTYAFFNYTRSGVANTIKTGRIAFNTSQSSGVSSAINLTNVFPISRSELGNDVNNSAEVVINIVGDTTYTNGLEYLVTFEDVEIETSTYKKIPIGISVIPEKQGELGTSNDNYFNSVANGGRGGNTSYYKVLAGSVLKDGDYVLVGYIRPGVAEINGMIGIKAFIDKDKILISDTYDGSESDNMGTLNNQATGKVVLTTEEWNALQGNNSISFKIRIQANEGLWLSDPLSRNDLLNFYNRFTSEEKNAITEINFIRMSEEMINTHSDLRNFTADGGQGVVKGWIDGTKLYIASPGETYFPVNSSSLLSSFSNVTNIIFNNVNTSLVTNMSAIFQNCTSLTHIDLTSFNTNSVTNMNAIFDNCKKLTSVNLDGLGSNSLTGDAIGMFSASGIKNVSMRNFNFGTAYIAGLFSIPTKIETIDLSNSIISSSSGFSNMFNGSQSIKKINMDGIDFGSNSLYAFFANIPTLQEISLKNVNTSQVTNMISMFENCTSLREIDLSSFNTSNVQYMAAMFQKCTSLETIDLSSFNTSNVTVMGYMFAMGTNSGNAWTPSNNVLTRIYVGNGWNVDGVTNSKDMFYNNTHLVGGAGTPFDENNPIDKTYAHVDGGQSNPGYLTLKTN